MRIKGIIIIGFKTVGKLNRIAVLILKREGIKEIRPKLLNVRLLLKTSKQIANPTVAPPPPINTNKSLNGKVIICGNFSPAAAAT